MTDRRKQLWAIGLAALNAVVSATALVEAGDYLFIRNLAVVSFIVFGFLCLLETGNLLLLARTFILGFIGYFPMIIKVLLGEHALFSGYERSTQGFDVVVTMYVITSFALLSNAVGLALAKRSRGKALVAASAEIRPKRLRLGTLRLSYWWLAGCIGVLLTLYSSYAFIKGYGQSILVAGYASDEQTQQGLAFGSVGVLGTVGVFSLFVAGMKGYIHHWKAVFVIVAIIFIVFSQLLMGVRQDAMSTLFGLVILYGLCRHRELGLRMWYVPIIAVAYVFFEAWGVARTALSAGIPFTTIVQLAFSGVGATEAVRFGTVSPIATTFANTVYMLDHRVIDFTYGKSYLEWILRIPPEALYPDRPKDYALMFERFGLLSGGGFFELAEVYMNFGLPGALVIPGTISFAMGKAYFHAMRRQSVLSYFLMFAILGIFLRGTWYQTFAFFRAFLVCILLYAFFVSTIQIVRLCRRTARRQEVETTGLPLGSVRTEH